MKGTITGISVADYVGDRLDVCGKTQQEVAAMCGFARPQMISMVKHGRTRVPLEKVRVLARALNVAPLPFFRLVLGEYHPDLLWFLDESVRGAVPAVTAAGV